MTKTMNLYVCQACGASSKKWTGRCESCLEWNSIQEETTEGGFGLSASKILKGSSLDFVELSMEIVPKERVLTEVSELDRVLGGGLVRGSAILLGGDPGIGKSTLLLQLVARLARMKNNVVYVTGEESAEQVSLRAKRLKLDKDPVKLLAATCVEDVITSLKKHKDLSLVVIDSIQTMFLRNYNSAPGTVSQVKASAFELINYAKTSGVIVILVGHVTKDGQIAGPKVLEHMVDTVLYFEGERGHHFRILRAVKNRFGGVNEIGVFEMSDKGLLEVTNPSKLFLNQRERAASGSVVFPGIEGTRPILVEVQALVASTNMATPRRAVVGADSNRLAMILAVLGARYGTYFGDKEVYLNIAGGLEISEPALDLAAAAAILSSLSNIALPKNTIVFGEVGLSGEIRLVNQIEARIKEAEKLGFENVILPFGSKLQNDKLKLIEIGHIKQLKEFFSNK